VDQALLLRAVYRIVGGLEVGDQNPLEILEQILEEAAFTRRPVQEDNIFEAGEHPDVPEREIGDSDSPGSVEREAGFHGQAFLVEGILRKHDRIG
jgi:hypothetical protein